MDVVCMYVWMDGGEMVYDDAGNSGSMEMYLNYLLVVLKLHNSKKFRLLNTYNHIE